MQDKIFSSSYKVFFAPNYCFDQQKSNSNIELINKIISKYEKEIAEINQNDVLIKFGWHSRFSLGALGLTYLIDIPKHKNKIIKYFRDEGISNYEDFKYFIYLATEIFDDANNIFKIFTIAHELQHVFQYMKNRCSYFIHNVLFRYFILRKKDNRTIKNLPNEYDARRKAKIINYKIHGEIGVDEYICKKLNENIDNDERDEWNMINNIDVSKDFNLSYEDFRFWSKYKNGIHKEIESIRRKGSSRTDDEIELIEAYELLKNNCK
jgi:hypothetical protein